MRRQGGRKVSEKALLTSTKPCPESVVRDLFVRYTWARLGGVSSKAGEAAAGPAKAAPKPPSPRKAGTIRIFGRSLRRRSRRRPRRRRHRCRAAARGPPPL